MAKNRLDCTIAQVVGGSSLYILHYILTNLCVYKFRGCNITHPHTHPYTLQNMNVFIGTGWWRRSLFFTRQCNYSVYFATRSAATLTLPNPQRSLSCTFSSCLQCWERGYPPASCLLSPAPYSNTGRACRIGQTFVNTIIYCQGRFWGRTNSRNRSGGWA